MLHNDRPVGWQPFSVLRLLLQGQAGIELQAIRFQ